LLFRPDFQVRQASPTRRKHLSLQAFRFWAEVTLGLPGKGARGHGRFRCRRGPAGLAAVIAVRKRGFRVTVADGAQPPIAKACGEGLLPDAVTALLVLGVTLREEDGCVLRGIRFEDGPAPASAKFPRVHGIGTRRETLHQRMMERALDHGVNLHWNTPVTRLHGEGVVVGGNKISARWIIGADGIS
jgi:2-polyprenyl-6-methoxyphenol hydroxylase-like FAD-dependent oxidoreductase